MKLKYVLPALALALSGAAAFAGPVALPTTTLDADSLDAFGNVSVSNTFHVDASGLYSLSVTSQSAIQGNVSLLSLSLLNSSLSGYTFGSSGSALPTPVSVSSVESVFGMDFELWTTTFTFDSLALTAGDWKLTVSAHESDNKDEGTLDGAITASVPEPGSLALVLGAVAALGWTRKSRKFDRRAAR